MRPSSGQSIQEVILVSHNSVAFITTKIQTTLQHYTVFYHLPWHGTITSYLVRAACHVQESDNLHSLYISLESAPCPSRQTVALGSHSHSVGSETARNCLTSTQQSGRMASELRYLPGIFQIRCSRAAGLAGTLLLS